ncbi:hypothetical protein HC891_27030 [Candidatus Gracilibacteria bacterium]|nr:hypothetical protein [Candidatus Gracilibacteria bacterium]
MLSQADTDLLALEQARVQLPADFAPLQLAHVGRVIADAAIDAILDELLPRAAVVVCRLHSARSFAYGLERLRAWADATGGFLLCIPAVEALDPDLMARSTVGVPLAHLVNAYFQCGGAANLANGLSCLSDHLLLTGWGYEPPVELPDHGSYMAEATEAPCGTGCTCCHPIAVGHPRDSWDSVLPRPSAERQHGLRGCDHYGDGAARDASASRVYPIAQGCAGRRIAHGAAVACGSRPRRCDHQHA